MAVVCLAQKDLLVKKKPVVLNIPAGVPLSKRECGILSLLAAGDSNKAIAISLSLQEATIKTHVKKILRKLGVVNRTQAAIWAIRHEFQNGLQDNQLVRDGKAGIPASTPASHVLTTASAEAAAGGAGVVS